MKAGTRYSKKKYKFYSIFYLITGIIILLLGAILAIAVLPIGIFVVLIGIFQIVISRKFKKYSIEGGFSKEVEEFISTSEVKGHIKFNDNTKQVLISPEENPRIVNYSDILGFELIENGKSIVTEGGLGRAAAGGMLFGETGAIVGGITAKRESTDRISMLKIKIVIKDMNNPNAYISFINRPTETDSLLYKASYDVAQKILAMLQIATSQAGVTS
jgi:hypothetical protein